MIRDGGQLDDVVAIAAGGESERGHTCAVRTDGSVWCWGINDRRQLGAGDCDGPCPVGAVKVPGVERASDVSVGAAHTCARIEDGRLWCWGSRDNGALGRNFDDDPELPVETGLRDVVDLSLGDGITCVRDVMGAACFGKNRISLGVLGGGVLGPDSDPEPVRVLCAPPGSCSEAGTCSL